MEKNEIQAELILSPYGHVFLDVNDHVEEHIPSQVFEILKTEFDKSHEMGLLHLGIRDFATPLPASFLFWQTFSRKFVAEVCKQTLDDLPPPNPSHLQTVIDQAMFIKGFEYLNLEVLLSIWNKLVISFKQELEHTAHDVQSYLKQFNPRWNLVGRVCFHLAENKKDEKRPFAFLATFTTHLSHHATAQHLPLKRALQDYAGEQNRSAMLALLSPIQKAAEGSPMVKSLVDSGGIFQAQAWSPREAHQFLQDIPVMEASGLMVRIPNWWNSQKPPRPKVKVTVGENSKTIMGLSSLLDFDIRLMLDNGETLTHEEWQDLLNASDNLVKIKGNWVEVDRTQLQSVLSHWTKLQRSVKDGLTMAESLRLLAGASGSTVDGEVLDEWSAVTAGNWLHGVLDKLRNPRQYQEKEVETVLNQHLKGTLRPYQLAGVQWLWLLCRLQLGGCLADDMGLGKTIQVLSIFLMRKHAGKDCSTKKPHLLVVPASLLGNWLAEATRFAPSLKIYVAHNSAKNNQENMPNLADIDIVLTTYGNVHRLEWLKETEWDLLILDEAQLIKNPTTKQTRSVKALVSQVRLTLTGTPIENRLSDLWSLFDFTSPGLLGTSDTFSKHTKKASKDISSPEYRRFISGLRSLTQPYILRRLKTDKSIISDLPDKTEMQSYCTLSKDQVRLYQQAVNELGEQLDKADGIQRKGVVLSYLLRLKQICNHPTQWLGYGEYSKEASGKFSRLQEICEEIAAKQEKVLVFTQFREIIPALANFLTPIFGREGLILHGDTAINKRSELVASFQQEHGPPFFILSLKAGGTGLNLTRASHVIHFDRWWNPAVENQATDRAYRIGQKHPVLVHKFICLGTIEEKIDDLITSKKNLSKDLLEGGDEVVLTNLSNEQLLELVTLDIQKTLIDL